MKAFTTTALIAAVAAVMSSGIGTADAWCYWVGDKYVSRENARYHADRACKGYAGAEVTFEGDFAAEQKKQLCVESAAGKHLLLSVKNTRRLTRSLGGDCVTMFYNIIEDCSRGGGDSLHDFEFVIDPNIGRC